MPRSDKARYWLLTIPHHGFTPYLPAECAYLKGQLESGGTTDYLHWQVLVAFPAQVRLPVLQRIFGQEMHAEATRSSAADEYVWKEETAVPGTQFELGKKLLNPKSKTDWDEVWNQAKAGQIESLPGHVKVRCFNQVTRIYSQYSQAQDIRRRVWCIWGAAGIGKSRKAREILGEDYYPKNPNSKFWCGYNGQTNVLIDEFRGNIDISHFLIWTDRYRHHVDTKGGSMPSSVKKIAITSNKDPREWYPDLDDATKGALLRRMKIIHVTVPLYPDIIYTPHGFRSIHDRDPDESSDEEQPNPNPDVIVIE